MGSKLSELKKALAGKPYKVYESGPMESSGRSDFNYHMFHNVEQCIYFDDEFCILPDGYTHLEVINPARNFNGDTTLPREQYLELALRQVDECQAIVMLPDWTKSPGSRLELQRALHNGAKCYTYTIDTDGEYINPVANGVMRQVLRDTAQPMAAPEPETINQARRRHGLEPFRDPAIGDRPVYRPETPMAAPEAPMVKYWRETLQREREYTKAHMAAWADGIESHKGEDDLPPRQELLEHSIDLIMGDRNNQYGPPTQDFKRTAALWSAFGFRFVSEDGAEPKDIAPHQIAIAQELLKVSRKAWQPGKKDHWADTGGYAGCGWECVVAEGLDEPQ